MVATVACVASKGGVLKSTICRALATEAAKNGLSVKLADLDLIQATSLDWSRRRLENDIKPAVSVEAFRTVAQALAIADNYEMLVIDAPARASEGTRQIAESVDLVVQPSNTSLDDLLPAVKLFHELVKVGVPRKRLVFALTLVLTEPEEIAARAFITEAGFSVLPGSIPSKASLRDCQNHGRAINESKYPALNARVDEVLAGIIDLVEI